MYFANYDEGKLPPADVRNFNLWDANEAYDAYTHPNCNCYIDENGDWITVKEGEYPCDICLKKQKLWNARKKSMAVISSLKGRRGRGTRGQRFEDVEDMEFESYSDYPDSVKNNAKAALDWAEKNGWGSCGTPVGKARANQLANGEAISVETIKRMYSYLSRHEVDLESSTSFSDGCGYLMYMSWGGKSALSWSRNKLKELGALQDNMDMEMEFSAQSDKQVIVGPALIPNKRIYRKDEDGEYYVVFTEDVIRKMVSKFNRSNNNRSINIDHSNQIVNGFVQQNWIIEDNYYDKSKMYGFNLPVGTWFVEIKIDDKQFWDEKVKGDGKYSFSIEGLLGQRLVKMEKDMSIDEIIDSLTEDEIKEVLNMLSAEIKEEEFVIEPKSGESKEEFISRCIPYEINNGYEQSQAAAICYSKWSNK